MLTRVVLILTDYYKEKIQNSSIYEVFFNAVQMHQAAVTLLGIEDFLKALQEGTGLGQEESDKRNTLYISDDKEVLESLQNNGYFTIALYHEAVAEILSGTQYAMEGLEDIDWDYFEKIHQRYCRVPWHITETQRCMIREMGVEDLEDLYELYADSHVTRYTESLFQDKEQEKQYIQDYIENIYKYYGFGTWLIHRKEDGRLIGRAGFNYRPGFEEVELGFVIGYPFWRNGYAYEVCEHLLKIGKTAFEFEKVQALADKENEASIQLLEKLGFCYSGDVIVEGQKYQRYLYG